MFKIIFIREMQVKNHNDITTYLLEWRKFKRMIIASADENVEQPELSYTSGGCKNYTDTLEDKSAICYNVKHYNDL